MIKKQRRGFFVVILGGLRGEIPVITIRLWKEGKWWVIDCPEFCIATQGRNIPHALDRFKEAYLLMKEEAEEHLLKDDAGKRK